MTTDDFLSAASDFNLLSLRDLVAARDQFHLHLINKPHVVATAVGRYRIRMTCRRRGGREPYAANL
jgi:hypothetical protein